jgi:hypothetical protein
MKKQSFVCLVFITIHLVIFPSFASAQRLDLRNATIISTANSSFIVKNSAIRTLQEEVKKRTSINFPVSAVWGKGPEIVLAINSENSICGIQIPKRTGAGLPEIKPEGYRILYVKQNGKDVVWIIGADDRGLLFGIGKFLRTAIMTKNKITLDAPLDFASSPMQSIRGHQLGYRNTNNTLDAWDVKKYEQYIRELVLFGTNAVETIPLDDNDSSPLMPIPPAEMNIHISEICAAYGIENWIWTPATCDLKDKELRARELLKNEKIYKSLPQLDGVFFPGGDPGENHPREVMPFLHDLYNLLIKYHPKAGIWISLQGFSEEQIDYFYTYLEENKPEWLSGIVSGPSSPSIAETRFRLPARYKHRQYPDITHNVRCDYPVVNWDQAYMLTIGREGINPMPNYYAKIHETYAQFTDGFISYSDGVHDDVNKITWSMRGWDLNQEPVDIMNDYCRFFFGPEVASKAAKGIMALEQNWVGPIRKNGAIEPTFEYWQKLEKENPQLAGNWRWQMLVVRAYYDTYQHRRKIYEEGLEKEANKILATAKEIGSGKAMSQALELVNQADTKPRNQDLHTKIVSYCDDLFHSIGYQSDVEKYHASNSQRSCILQFVNYPLNNRWWLTDEFKKITLMDSEAKKLERLEVICKWENPGPGSYYDNVSNIETGPRVVTTSYDATDVAWWEGGKTRKRLSSQLFQPQPTLEYINLDFNGRYNIRVSGRGEALLRVDGMRLDPIAYDKEIGGFKEFIVPKNLTQDGTIKVTFDRPEESHIRWSSQSHVSDVWLIKK